MLIDVGWCWLYDIHHWLPLDPSPVQVSKSPGCPAVGWWPSPGCGSRRRGSWIDRNGQIEWGMGVHIYIYIYIYIPHMFFFPRYYEDMKILFNICVNKYVYLMMFFPYVVHVCPVDMAIHWTGLVAFIPAVTPDGDRWWFAYVSFQVFCADDPWKNRLVGGDWNMTFIFPDIGNVIIPVDQHFSEG